MSMNNGDMVLKLPSIGTISTSATSDGVYESRSQILGRSSSGSGRGAGIVRGGLMIVPGGSERTA